MLDYRIETFLQVCERMNYRKAADALGITWLAISTTVTFTPWAVRFSASSRPIKPAPTTTAERHLFSSK